MAARTLARTLTNVLNPFAIFTALYALVALSEVEAFRALLYVALELLAAAAVAGYVLLMRRHSRVGDFWISARAHCTVVGHAATAGLLVLGFPGIIFAVTLPLVVWARVALGAHTTSEALAGAAVGAVSALLFLT
jgi:hypothetical protein